MDFKLVTIHTRGDLIFGPGRRSFGSRVRPFSIYNLSLYTLENNPLSQREEPD